MENLCKTDIISICNDDDGAKCKFYQETKSGCYWKVFDQFCTNMEAQQDFLRSFHE